MSRSIVLACGVIAAFAVAAPARLLAATPQSLYNDNCSACHQASGKGVKGAFPALAGDPLVQGDPTSLMTVVLAGRASMPGFKDDLNDADLAALLSYVRASWGNSGKPVTPADVAAARAKLNTAKQPRAPK
jgi:mono/diheme cytochrome c family protein